MFYALHFPFSVLPILAHPIISVSSDSLFLRRLVNQYGRKEGLLRDARLGVVVITVGALHDLFSTHFQEIAQRLVSPVVLWR